MSAETKKLFQYLSTAYNSNPALKDIFHTFCHCSTDSSNHRSLVNSNLRCINFDRLTTWVFPSAAPQSADSMTFSKKYIYLIEFKAGDQIKHENKKEKLIRSVMGKINDSEQTLYSSIFPKINSFNEHNICIRFFLVVDTKEMGISHYAASLASLSLGSTTESSPEIKELFLRVLPELKTGVIHPNHFDQIDIWYSELFDAHLKAQGIVDIEDTF